MHLVYVGNSPLDIHTIAPWASWLIVIGALYGIVRLVIDVCLFLRGASRQSAEHRARELERRRAADDPPAATPPLAPPARHD